MMNSIPYKIILASNSPRRRELLAGLGIDFEVRVIKGISEAYPHDLPASQIPQFIAREKAAAYQVKPGELVITADTVVMVGDEQHGSSVLGKPKDADEAWQMLRTLSGRAHHVITGVCLTTHDDQRLFSVTTEVNFRELSDDEIEYYITHYRPFDKAGAYGIQEWIGYVGVTGIRGSYFNVMGLPVQRIWQELRQM